MSKVIFIPLPDYHEYPVGEMQQRVADFCTRMQHRRTVRDFSSRPVPRDIIEHCLKSASARLHTRYQQKATQRDCNVFVTCFPLIEK